MASMSGGRTSLCCSSRCSQISFGSLATSGLKVGSVPDRPASSFRVRGYLVQADDCEVDNELAVWEVTADLRVKDIPPGSACAATRS